MQNSIHFEKALETSTLETLTRDLVDRLEQKPNVDYSMYSDVKRHLDQLPAWMSVDSKRQPLRTIVYDPNTMFRMHEGGVIVSAYYQGLDREGKKIRVMIFEEPE